MDWYLPDGKSIVVSYEVYRDLAYLGNVQKEIVFNEQLQQYEYDDGKNKWTRVGDDELGNIFELSTDGIDLSKEDVIKNFELEDKRCIKMCGHNLRGELKTEEFLELNKVKKKSGNSLMVIAIIVFLGIVLMN